MLYGINGRRLYEWVDALQTSIRTKSYLSYLVRLGMLPYQRGSPLSSRSGLPARLPSTHNGRYLIFLVSIYRSEYASM